jgi:hypothetical protein
MLVVATSDPLHVRQMAETARTLNREIEVVVRSDSEDESQMLRKDGIGTVFFGHEELARNMAGHVLDRFAPRWAAPRSGQRLKDQRAAARRPATGPLPAAPARRPAAPSLRAPAPPQARIACRAGRAPRSSGGCRPRTGSCPDRRTPCAAGEGHVVAGVAAVDQVDEAWSAAWATMSSKLA